MNALRSTSDAPQRAEGLFREWIDSYAGKSPYTVRNYRSHVRKWLAWCEARGLDPLKAGRAQLRAYSAHLEAGGMSDNTRTGNTAVVRVWYKWLARRGHVEANAMRGFASVSRPRKRLPRALAVADVERMLESVDTTTPAGLRDRAMLEALYGAGLRVSELVALDLGDVDPKGTLHVRHGKGDRERRALFGEQAARALGAYLVNARLELGADTGRDAPLFVNQRGGRLSVRAVQDMVKAAGRAVGVKATPHSLRHSFATHLMNNGADLLVVQQLLGHTSADTTSIYTHVSKAQLAEKTEDAFRTINRKKVLH